MHGHFILPGDVDVPIVFEVDRLRDGNSFTTRRIVAIQHGRPIFNMAASFQTPEDGAEHQADTPTVPGPDELPRELELIRAVEEQIPEDARPFYTRERPIEFRPVEPVDPFGSATKPPANHVWFRARGALPDDRLTHQSVLAYASDYGLLSRRCGRAAYRSCSRAYSLRPSTTRSGFTARSFTRGQIFAQDDSLVASVAQEGLMRVWGE